MIHTVRINNIKLLSEMTNRSPILAVFKGDGYYPINKDDVLNCITQKKVTSATRDDNGRVDITINDRSIGQYITLLPSLEYAKTHFYPKDYSRLHPDNDLSKRRLNQTT